MKISGALLIAGAVIGTIGNAMHPHTAFPDPAATVQAIAQNGSWVAIHLGVIVAILLIIGGLVGLADVLRGPAAEPVARLGVAAALIGGTVVTVSTAIDGFGRKALAVAVADAPSTEAGTALRIAIAVNDAQFGLWSIGMLVFFGATFACFGGAVLASRQFPAWFGWVALVGAAGSAVAALLQVAANGQVQAAETTFLVSSIVLTVWTLAVGIRLWRGAASELAYEPSLVEAGR
ncbi:MAG: DUF4386 family protein [Candidatus Limnocylindria bacterium]